MSEDWRVWSYCNCVSGGCCGRWRTMVFSLALSQWAARACSLAPSTRPSCSFFSLAISVFCYTCTYSQVIFPYTPKRCLSLSLSIRRRHAVRCVAVPGSEPTPGETSSAALMDLPFQPCSVRQQEPRPSPSPSFPRPLIS